MEIIEFKNLSFRYPNCEKNALNKVNIEIQSSDFIVICGKSGCGKSTLLRHMKKNLMPYGEFQGEVYYNGVEISDLDDRVSASHIGFVQQNPDNQIVTDKVWHELAFGLENLGYSNKIIRRRVAEMASFFGIQTWFRKSIFELSGGQKQLLNLASIMAMQPKIIVLDEPTSQLDPIAATEFLETLRKINRELGTTIIISEHRLEEVFPMANKIIVMEEGEVIAYDSADKIGRFLSHGKERHSMFLALPAPMKIYAELKSDGECPVTVREGRLWLNKLLNNKVKFTEIKKGIEEKSFYSKEEIVIELSDVWFRYERNGQDVVQDLSLKVKKGEIFCLVGGNGVGKSTALKIIMGINKPYRGKVFINQKEIKNYSKKELFNQNIGVLPQNPQSIFTEITVEEELYEMLFYEDMKDKEKKYEVNNILSLLQLEHLIKNHPYDLSGGEQQRLALGKILLLKPKILLLDEPTKGLDPFFKSILANILKTLKAQGVTMLIVTHDLEFCAEQADTCAMFFDGSIVTQDEPRAFFGGNSFYTTIANRMSRHIFQNAITYKDVVDLCVKNMM